MAHSSDRSNFLSRPFRIQQKDIEDFQDEYLEWKSKYYRSKKEHDKLLKHFQITHDKFVDTEQQTIALANSLGPPSTITYEHAALVEQVNQLNIIISDKDFELNLLKNQILPTNIAPLQKDFNDVYVACEKLNSEIKFNSGELDHDTFEYCKSICDDHWNESWHTNMENLAISMHTAKLHDRMRLSFRNSIYSPHKRKPRSQLPPDSIELSHQLKLVVQLENLKSNIEFIQTKRTVYLLHVINEIHRINEELEEDEIDVPAKNLLEKYFPDGVPSEQKRVSDSELRLMKVRVADYQPVYIPDNAMDVEATVHYHESHPDENATQIDDDRTSYQDAASVVEEKKVNEQPPKKEKSEHYEAEPKQNEKNHDHHHHEEEEKNQNHFEEEEIKENKKKTGLGAADFIQSTVLPPE